MASTDRPAAIISGPGFALRCDSKPPRAFFLSGTWQKQIEERRTGRPCWSGVGMKVKLFFMSHGY